MSPAKIGLDPQGIVDEVLNADRAAEQVGVQAELRKLDPLERRDAVDGWLPPQDPIRVGKAAVKAVEQSADRFGSRARDAVVARPLEALIMDPMFGSNLLIKPNLLLTLHSFLQFQPTAFFLKF